MNKIKCLHNRFNIVFTATLCSTFLLLFPSVSFAAPPSITIKPIIGFLTLGQALNTIFAALFFFGALLMFFFIINGALKYLTSGDNAANTAAGRTMITNAIVGFIILGAVFVIFKVAIVIVPGMGQFFK